MKSLFMRSCVIKEIIREKGRVRKDIKLNIFNRFTDNPLFKRKRIGSIILLIA